MELVIGGMSAVFAGSFSNPLEVIKIRMQVSNLHVKSELIWSFFFGFEKSKFVCSLCSYKVNFKQGENMLSIIGNVFLILKYCVLYIQLKDFY